MVTPEQTRKGHNKENVGFSTEICRQIPINTVLKSRSLLDPYRIYQNDVGAWQDTSYTQLLFIHP